MAYWSVETEREREREREREVTHRAEEGQDHHTDLGRQAEAEAKGVNMEAPKGKDENVKSFLKALGDKDEDVRSAVLEVAKQNAKR